MGRFKGKKKKTYPHERRNVEDGFIPPQFIDYYHQQFVPDTLSEEDFQTMINTFKQPLSHTFRIVGSSSLSSDSDSTPEFDPLRAKLHHDIATFLDQLQNNDESNSNQNNDNDNDEPQQNQNNESDPSSIQTQQNHAQSDTKNQLNKTKVTIEKITCLNDMFGEIYQLSADKPTLRRDPSLGPLRNWLNVNMKIGNIVRQELVSMVPPFFLDLHPNSRVLDVAAAPGSKTSQILNYVNQGLVVANDVNVTRSTMLVHNLGRLRSLSNEEVIVISHPAQYLPLFEYMQNESDTKLSTDSKPNTKLSTNSNPNSNLNVNSKLNTNSNSIKKFDRVLCDVPCSGDGTLRKNPDACLKFSLENGAELHQIQRAILIRALKHLEEGGTLVYSTCSMNPVEDEAVVSSVVLESNGTVEIVDVSHMFPDMKRSRGMRNWKVLSEFRTPTMYAAYDPAVHSTAQASKQNEQQQNEDENDNQNQNEQQQKQDESTQNEDENDNQNQNEQQQNEDESTQNEDENDDQNQNEQQQNEDENNQNENDNDNQNENNQNENDNDNQNENNQNENDNDNQNENNQNENDNQNENNQNENDNDNQNEDESPNDCEVVSIPRSKKKRDTTHKPDFDYDLLSRSESKVAPNIEHCMRFFPHQNDTGGFFVSVLRKTSTAFDHIINEPHLPHKPSFKWRESPYYRLIDISPTKGEILSRYFGLDGDFVSNLFVRDEDESLIRNIFYCSAPASDVVAKLASEELRAVSCGVRVFTWKEFKDDNTVKAVPCIEGVSLLRKFIPPSNERLVLVGPSDMKMLLRAGNDGCKVGELQCAEFLRKLKVGGLMFVLDVDGLNVCYGGLLLKDNVLLYVKKDMIDQEIERIDIEIDSLSFLKK